MNLVRFWCQMNSNVSISRRKLLKLSAAGFGGAVTGLAGLNCGTASGASLNRQQQEVLDASQLITGKDKRLIVLKSGPAVFETPLELLNDCLLYTSPSPRDQRGSRMPSSA